MRKIATALAAFAVASGTVLAGGAYAGVPVAAQIGSYIGVDNGTTSVQVEARKRSRGSYPSSMRPGGRPGCCRVNTNFR